MDARNQEAARRGEPGIAALLTLFVPGLGHLYLGRPTFGFVAFLAVEGLYALGWWLSDGLVFSFLDPELRGRFAILLSPEAGNLGALLWHFRQVGFGPDRPVPWPDTIMLGSMLTSLSGLANVFLMVRAHLDARVGAEERARGQAPTLLVAAAWAVPGLGHVLQKRFLRGAIVFALLVGLFAWGTWLAELSNLSRERHFYYWAGQFLVGLPAVVAELVSGRPPVTDEIPSADVGLLFGCVAGLLNVLAMLDVYGFAEARLLDEDPQAARAADAEALDPASHGAQERTAEEAPA